MRATRVVYLGGGISDLPRAQARAWRCDFHNALIEAVTPNSDELHPPSVIPLHVQDPTNVDSFDVFNRAIQRLDGNETLVVNHVARQVVESDLSHLDVTDVMVWGYFGPSCGSSMEAFYMARTLRRPVVFLDLRGSLYAHSQQTNFAMTNDLSPWVIAHISYYARNVQNAVVAVVDLLNMRAPINFT